MQENNALFGAVYAITEGTDLWMLTYNTSVLLHFDITEMKLLDYHIISKEKIIQEAYLGVAKCGDIIYITPYRESKLVSFDVTSGEIRYIDIPYEAEEVRMNNKFVITVSWKSYLLLVGCGIKGIFYYDTVSGSFTKNMEYWECLQEEGCDVSNPLFSNTYFQKENKVYLPVRFKDIILEVDLAQKEYTIHRLNNDKIALWTIDGYTQGKKEKFLLTTVNDEMLTWSPADGVEGVKNLGLLRGRSNLYERAYHIGGKNYFISACERKVFVESCGQIRELEFEYESRGGYQEGTWFTQFQAVFKWGNDIYFQARSNGQLFRIDTRMDIIYQVDFEVTQEDKKDMLRRIYSSRKLEDTIMENMGFKLDDLLKCISAKKSEDE